MLVGRVGPCGAGYTPAAVPVVAGEGPDTLIADAAPRVTRARMVICKVTPNCNLDCSYCSAVATGPDGTIEKIPDETYLRAVELFVGHTREPMIEWLFHGGEPLLLPAEWYRWAMDHVERVARANPHLERLVFSMQSNAVALRQSHLDLFVERGVTVSASLDGMPELNDLQRGRGAAALRNIRRLAEAGVGGGVITILTPNNIDHVDRILDFFAGSGVSGVKLNNLACVGRGVGESTITGEQYAHAMLASLSRMARTGSVDPMNHDLLTLLELYLRRGADRVEDWESCYSYTCAAARTFFGVEYNGDVYPCGRAADTGAFRLLNLMERRLDAEGYERARLAIHHKDAWYVRCFDCAARRICSFGCPAFEAGNPAERELQCRFIREVYRQFQRNPHLIERARQVLDQHFSGLDDEEPGIDVTSNQQGE
jgi:uncharacterized protein